MTQTWRAGLIVLALAAGSVGGRAQSAPPGSVGDSLARGSVTVIGTVYDSLARRPLPAARVELVSAENTAGGRIYSALSDSSGRYAVEHLPPGKYLAGFFAASLDTLGFDALPRVVSLAAGSHRVDLATPSAATLMALVCPARSPGDSSGLLVGHVYDTDTRMPVAGAGVGVEWRELELDGSGIRHQDRSVTARTSERGWFAVCGVPPDASLHSRAGHGADSTGYVEIEMPPASVRHVSFQIGGGSRVPVGPDTATSGTSEALMAWRGRSRVTGTVRDARGQPLAGAHALVWGTARTVTTDAAGSFTLDGLPGGTQTLDVSGIGHVPSRTIVNLAESRPVAVDVQLQRMPTMLEAVTIRDQALYATRLAEFDRRQRAGIGFFVTGAVLEKNRSRRLTDVLRSVPGVMLEDRGGRTVVQMRGSGTLVDPTFCTPSLYIDRASDAWGDFDQLRVDEIAAIEVYSRPADRPFEFVDQRNACGAVVVWTRTRARVRER